MSSDNIFQEKFSLEDFDICYHACFSHDTKKFITLSSKNELRYYEFNTKEEIHERRKSFVNHQKGLLFKSSMYLLYPSKNSLFGILDLDNFEVIKLFPFEQSDILAFSNNAKYIIFQSNNKLYLFDIDNNSSSEIGTFTDIKKVIFSHNSFAFAVLNDNTVDVFSTTDLEDTYTFNLFEKDINIGGFDDINRIFIYSNSKFEIKVFSAYENDVIRTFKGHNSTINSMSFNTSFTYLLTSSSDKTIKLWDLKFLFIHTKSVNEHNDNKHFINNKKEINTDSYTYEPIGFVNTNMKSRFESPRQGVHAKGVRGVIELKPYKNFEQAVQDLEGIERLWIIYAFHLNDGWKPLVSPPRFHERKIGVFATRSPFRPNSIGISCVRLDKVDGLKIYISELDLLDGTPVLDIKPYIPYADSFPDSKTGWLKPDKNVYEIKFLEKALEKSEWMLSKLEINISNYCKVQLQFEPFNEKRKRISKLNLQENGKDLYCLSFRGWDLLYSFDIDNKKVYLHDIVLNNSAEKRQVEKRKDSNDYKLFSERFK